VLAGRTRSGACGLAVLARGAATAVVRHERLARFAGLIRAEKGTVLGMNGVQEAGACGVVRGSLPLAPEAGAA